MPGSLPPLDATGRPRPPFVPPLLLGVPGGEDWVRVADLALPAVLGPALDAMAEARGYPDPATIGAGFALLTAGGSAELAWRAAAGEPLPALDPQHTWWQLKPTANVTAVAVDRQPATVEAGDFGAALHALLDDLLASVHTATGFPLRALWSMVASAIGSWLLRLMPGEPERAIERANAMFKSDAILRAARPRVTWFELEGRRRAFTTRRVCCFNYRGRHGEYCSSECPIVPAGERLAAALARERTV